MRAVIICGGCISDYDYIKKRIRNDDVVICADSGYDHAVRLRVKADLVVGDLDSVSGIEPGVEIVKYPVKKDMTDSEIAINHARSMGIRSFLIIAGTGGRMDHTLTNILMLKACLERGEDAELIDERNRIMITGAEMCLHGQKGGIVSLIPLTDCEGVTTKNLAYPLNEDILRVGESRGVSNIMEGGTASVSVEKGVLLVIEAKD